jgi:RNA polymerase sigma-70 factor, ECF subfamily
MNLSRRGGVYGGQRTAGPQPTGELVIAPPTRGDTQAARQPSDAELLRRVQADDLDAFETLFARYRAPIFRTAFGLTGDRGAAEEILQDAFVRAYRKRHELRTDVSPLPWLHRVSLNLCYSRLSRPRLASTSIDRPELGELLDHGPQPAEQVERGELRTIVREAIRSLGERHRDVVVLYYLHRMSLQETADLLGVPLGTVKSRLHHALRGLRLQLEADRRFGGAYRAPDDEAEAGAW